MRNCVLPPHNAAFLPVKMRSLLIIAADAWGENAQWEELVKAQPCVAQVCRQVYVTSFSKTCISAPAQKTVLAITPSRGFRGRQGWILGRKWMCLPSLQPSSVFLSRFHLRYIRSCRCGGLCRGRRFLFGMWDIPRISAGFNTENWLMHWEIDWEPDRKLLLCLLCLRFSAGTQLWCGREHFPTLGVVNSIQECCREQKMLLYVLYVPLAKLDITLFLPASFMM